jgi:hypothetical protein
MSLISRALAAGALCAVACITVHGQVAESASAAPLADTVLWGLPLAPAWRTADLPRDVQEEIAVYRQRERTFRSGLKAPRGATAVERGLFDKRVAIERVLFCLFPRRDIARVAASFASDAEVAHEWEGQADAPRREAAFIDSLLPDLQQLWLAPYLNLIAGHRKLCASQLQGSESQAGRQALAEEAKRQLARARDGGHPLIRVVANHLLATGRCIIER